MSDGVEKRTALRLTWADRGVEFHETYETRKKKVLLYQQSHLLK